MTTAGVDITLIDQSSYIPSGRSVYAGIAGAFLKGPLEPTLCTSQAQFLNWFAPDGKPKIGYPQEYQSALDYLADADALWVVRAYSEDNPPLYGGIVVNTVKATTSYTELSEGLEDPNDYKFEEAEAVDAQTNAALITGCNPGAWNNDVYITLTPNTTASLEYTAFDLKVFKTKSKKGNDNVYTELESFIVSFTADAVDGYGSNMYIENVVNDNSNYIRVRVNEAIDFSKIAIYVGGITKEVSLGKGADGAAVSTNDYIAAIQKLSNPDELSLQLLLDGGNSDITYANTLLEMAGTDRMGECFCVLTTPQDSENNTTGKAIDNLKTYRNGISSSYTYLGSMYTPHVKIYDRFNDRFIWNAPDGIVARKINAAIRDFGYNYPAAGYTRGTMDNTLDVYTKFNGGELKALDEMQINPIKNDTSRGVVIMGNSRLYPANSDLQDQNNMLTINLQIKPGLREFLKDYLFDLNDEITRNIIVSKINLFMKDVKTQRGVSDFYVVCDNTNNSPNDVAQGILRIDLYVKMVKSIKFIKTNIIATAQGLDFSSFAQA